MQECHYELIKELIEIEILRKDFNSKQTFANTLSVCKKGILEGYTNSIEDLLIGYAHIIHELDDVYNMDSVKRRLAYLLKLFDRAKTRNFRKNIISKIFFFFDLFRANFEKEVLTKSSRDIYNHFDNELRESPREVYEQVLTRFYGLIELCYLFMSGIQIDCQNIKSDVVGRECFDIFNISSETVQNMCDENQECNLRTLATNKEYIHFFVLPEFRKKDFIKKSMAAIIEVHTAPKEIEIIVDYKLHPPFDFDDAHYSNFKLAKEIFRSVNFTNCSHIDFGDFANEIKVIKPDYHDALKGLMQRSRRQGKIPMTGEILTALDRANHVDIREALSNPDAENKPIGEILKTKNIIKDKDIEDVLIIQKRCKEELETDDVEQTISQEEIERILRESV